MATSRLFDDYSQILHDRFKKAREEHRRPLSKHLEDSFYGTASMFRSAFAWRMKPASKESETAKANRIIDELDAYFTPTLSSKRTNVAGQGQSRS